MNDQIETQAVEDDDIDILEEFQGYFRDLAQMEDRWKRLALKKEQAGDTVSAELIRLFAGDLFPLLSDVIVATGQSLDEAAAAAEASATEGLDEEDAIDVYTTLLANETAFRQLAENATAPEVQAKLTELVKLNLDAMGILKENYGDEIDEQAREQIREASVAVTEEA